MTTPDLCGACALCCNGALFDRLPVEADEARRLRALDVELMGTAANAALRQPCAQLVGRRCSIYADRPRGCVRFECDMLRAHRRGELTRAECLARIDRVQRFLLRGAGGVAAAPSYLLELAGLRTLIHRDRRTAAGSAPSSVADGAAFTPPSGSAGSTAR